MEKIEEGRNCHDGGQPKAGARENEMLNCRKARVRHGIFSEKIEVWRGAFGVEVLGIGGRASDKQGQKYTDACANTVREASTVCGNMRYMRYMCPAVATEGGQGGCRAAPSRFKPDSGAGATVL